jgi:hypothetical protein
LVAKPPGHTFLDVEVGLGIAGHATHRVLQ